MANVKIQGNSLGTGSLTIAAPNTNTDRTLTLPDESGTLLSSGGPISVGGLVTLTNGGIKFPASQVASSDANTLDDYEEGTFTPSIVFGGLTPVAGTNGRYTKIGNIVIAEFDITWPGTADTNNAGVYLPFSGIAGSYANAFIGYTNYGSWFTIENSLGSSAFYFNNPSGSGLSNANFSGKRVIATAVYHV